MENQLFINDIELDISQVIEFPLTYSIADAKQPEKRKRNASKTIKLPGTKLNNSFFTSAYDMALSDVYGDLVGFDFDPTLRYPCRALKNGKEIFRGSAHLAKVVQRSIHEVPVNEFHIVLYSEIANLFQALGDRLVSELGWSTYDHALTIANIQASWTAPAGSSYWYPLIDFGFTGDLLTYKTNELRPYVYIKEIVEKCLAVAGLTMTSAHFDSTLVKVMAWGFGGGEQVQLDSTEASARQAHYTGDGSKVHSIPNAYDSGTLISTWTLPSSYMPFSDNTNVTMTLVTDTNAQFDEPSGELVVFNSGSYRLNITGVFPVTYSLSDPFTNKSFTIALSMRIFKNGAFVAVQQLNIQDSVGATTNLTFNLIHEMELDAGDVITSDLRIDAVIKGDGYSPTSTFDLTVDLNNTLDYDFTALNVALVDGDTVQLSRFLPKMKATDFMKDMITLFNLYMGDPDENGDVVLEPIEDYFFETNDVDQWSDKLARGEEHPIDIMPASNIKGKTYAFHWATDRDYYKQLYFSNNGIDYGDYDYEVPSTFKKGIKKYQLKIAQTCPVQISGTNLIIPRIVKIDEGTMLSSPYKGKPRMFLNNGVIASDSWNLENSDTGALTANVVYPQAHHIDNLAAATFDLNFGVPVTVFYTATSYTTFNLFEKHYSDYIRQLTGRDSKLVNAFFNINESDLYVNFMRRLKNIDGVLFRVNIVKDYLATKNDVTQIELIKILKGRSRASYAINPPVGVEPNFDGIVGGNDAPITGDTTIRNNASLYELDASGGDIMVELPADNLKPGKRFTVKKVSAGGKITCFSTGGATGSSIDGKPTLIITGKNDAPDFWFDGTVFKVV